MRESVNMGIEQPESPAPSKPLSPKRRRFVEAYLTTWNASEAARQAGYKKEWSAGSFLMRIPEVRAAIEQRLKEAAMQADEVLSRLAEQGRIDISDFVQDVTIPLVGKDGELVGEMQGIRLNWDAIRAHGHLVKSVTATQYGPKIELHDGQKALELIGRHLALFTDNIALPGAKVKGYTVLAHPDLWDEDENAKPE